MADILNFPPRNHAILPGCAVHSNLVGPRINCQAIVDSIIPGRKYRVMVTGETTGRTYVIHERDEDRAAREGMRLFVREMGGV